MSTTFKKTAKSEAGQVESSPICPCLWCLLDKPST
jgi:hypothetical protein